MIKNMKWKIVGIVFIMALAIIFGSFFIYQESSIKGPIINALKGIETVNVISINVNNKSIEANISLSNVENFQEAYYQVLDSLASYENGRKIMINIENNANSEMLLAWNTSYFYIAEAIEQRKYSLIPETIDNLEEKNIFDYVNSTMDEENIYIDLHQGDLAFYVVIPAISEVEVNRVG